MLEPAPLVQHSKISLTPAAVVADELLTLAAARLAPRQD